MAPGRIPWVGGSSCSLTLSLLPALQKRNRAITARRQHLKVGVGCRGAAGEWGGLLAAPHALSAPPCRV
jgi:hypothetical protein